ncbi:DegV family protein [Kocuria sp. TGY1127_2]|uniref:DegV family protein n=1 Tax=Kocuria sp. TGY1127_2 TaxID=2711328 RepID=UPI0015BC101D|nr:DegV family protein [Kocuria sp. TGY1127_2]
MTLGREPRTRVAVVTDSAAGLAPCVTKEWIQTGGFACISLPLMIGDQIYTDSDDPGVQERLVVATAEGRRMTTSRPSPGAFTSVYESLATQGYEHIVSVHLSAELSGTVDSARSSARQASVPVSVIDSRSAAMGQGFAVAAARDAARAGAAPAEVEKAALHACDIAHMLFYVPNLDALAKSGRIPKSLAVVGQMFQIRPIATIAEGKLKYLERPRQEAAAIKRMVELVLDEAERTIAEDTRISGLPSGRAVVAIQDFYGRPLAELLSERVRTRFGEAAQVMRSTVPPVLAVHAGLGPVCAVSVPSSLVPGLSPTGR